jgi:hypothetical protein
MSHSRNKGLEEKIVQLVTNDEGRARFLREKVNCEDVIKPLKTRTIFDLTWGSVTVAANGYRSAERSWLQSTKYEDKGYFKRGHFHRIEFNIPLHRQ